jgi:hypothetical protein
MRVEGELSSLLELHGKENVGISNDKTGEKPVRRKSKGS